MKFLIVLAVAIAAVSARSFIDKGELEKRAAELEARLEKDAAKYRADPRVDIRELAKLDVLDADLRALSAALAVAVLPRDIEALETRLNALEKAVDAELERLEKFLTPTPTPANEATPTTSPLDKGELEKRAAELETRLEKDAAKYRGDPRVDIRELAKLDALDAELRVLAAELAVAVLPRDIQDLEIRLNALEKAVDEELTRLEKLLAPTPTPANEATASPAPTSQAPPQPSTGLPLSTKAPLDKGELEKRAAELEKRLEKDEARYRADPRVDVRELALLDLLDAELRVLAAELAVVVLPRDIEAIEIRLDSLEKHVDAELERLEKFLDTTPTPGPVPTSGAPQPTPSAAPVSTRA